MSKFKGTMDRAENYLKKNNRRKNIFFILIVVFSMSISASGFAFAGYVFLMIQDLKQTSLMLMQAAPKGDMSSVASTPQQLAGAVGENTIWVPIIAGFVIALLAVTYLFRIYVRRVVDFEDELLRLEKFKALEEGDSISDELRAAVLTSTLVRDKTSLPSPIPTVELAEKSITSISNILSRSSNIAGRFRRNA